MAYVLIQSQEPRGTALWPAQISCPAVGSSLLKSHVMRRVDGWMASLGNSGYWFHGLGGRYRASKTDICSFQGYQMSTTLLDPMGRSPFSFCMIISSPWHTGSLLPSCDTFFTWILGPSHLHLPVSFIDCSFADSFPSPRLNQSGPNQKP